MSKANEEQQTRLERARQIGLFRYMLIREAADATLTGRQRGALVRALAAQAHTEPDGRIVRITRWTLDRWIQNYREGGFDALVPSPRQSQPRTPPEVFELAAALKKENPSRSAAQVRRILHAQLGWAPNETTLQRMFVRTGLTALRAPVEPAVFGRFEAARPNEIWTGDALHGPRIGGRKTYLFAFLDDHCAPRGASLYPRRSRDELGGRFVGLMAYLDPKGEGDKSMVRHEALCRIPHSVGRNLEGCSWA